MASRDCIACNRTQLAIVSVSSAWPCGYLAHCVRSGFGDLLKPRLPARGTDILKPCQPLSRSATHAGSVWSTAPSLTVQTGQSRRFIQVSARGLCSGLQCPARPQVLHCSSSWQYRLNATNQQTCSDRQPAEAPHGKPDSTVLNPLLEHGLKSRFTGARAALRAGHAFIN